MGPRASLTTMVLRGLRRRCPRCSHGKLFVGWGRLVERCPGCGLLFEREEGYWVGAIIVNTAVTETIFALLFVPTLFATLPEVPWVPLLAIAVVTNTLVPLLFYPSSKTVWMGIDLYFHPAP